MRGLSDSAGFFSREGYCADQICFDKASSHSEGVRFAEPYLIERRMDKALHTVIFIGGKVVFSFPLFEFLVERHPNNCSH